MAFGANMGISSFTGESISKIKGVAGMDEASKLFFDAFFEFWANVFHTQAMTELFPEARDVPTTYSQTPPMATKPHMTQTKYPYATAY